MSKPALKAQKNYQKYLGKLASTTVKKNLNGYVAPDYYNSNHYVRTGATIVLLADSAYYQKYPDSQEKIFAHHFHPPYLHLAEKQFMGGTSSMTGQSVQSTLTGSWELNYITGPRITFTGLYPEKKPTVTFDTGASRVSGSTSCNSLNGPVTISGATIQFSDAMVMTKMMCPGEGERVFLNTLKQVNRYAITDENTLTLFMGDVAMMRFVRK